MTTTTTRRTLAVVMGLAAAAGPGCAFMDGITASMVRAGILAPTSPRASGLAGDAVVEVRTGSGRGTGVAVEGGYVLTAAHVVDGAARASVYRHSLIPGAPAAMESATVVWTDSMSDTALLRPESREACGPSGDACEGEAWLVTLAASGQGIAGPTRRPRLRLAQILPNRRFAVDGGVQPGDSGSPLVQGGRVVGVVRSADRYASAGTVTTAVRDLEAHASGAAVIVASAPREAAGRS